MSKQNKPQKPDPLRFEIKSELEDKTGFKVIGCNHVFKYDQHKGWYDESGNYYNAQGKPSQPPKEQKEEKKEESKAGEKKPADPSRFADYTVLPDETGFKIKGSEHVFYFDKYGGWFDEYDNYYDADGNPATDPEYSEEDDEEDDADDADDLAREYDEGEDEGGDEMEHFENIYLNTENQQTIESYKGKEIQIKAWNLPFTTTEDGFEKLLVDKKIDWILFEFEYNHRDQFNGYVHLTFDKANAEKFIQLNGEKYNGRNIKIKVEKPKVGDDDEEEEEAHGDDEGHGEEGEEEGDEQDKAPEAQ